MFIHYYRHDARHASSQELCLVGWYWFFASFILNNIVKLLHPIAHRICDDVKTLHTFCIMVFCVTFAGARQTVDLPVIWDAMTPVWRYGNMTHKISTWFNLNCCDLIKITNVYVLWNHIYMYLALLCWCCDKRMFARGDIVIISLQWSHNQRDGVSNHWCLVWLPNRFFSGADQRKHQRSASLAFVTEIHRWPVKSPHKGPVTRKCFHLLTSSFAVIWMTSNDAKAWQRKSKREQCAYFVECIKYQCIITRNLTPCSKTTANLLHNKSVLINDPTGCIFLHWSAL